jgi:hypothetical protein
MPTIQDPSGNTPTTLQESVNIILSVLGEAPVNSLTGTTASLGLNIIEEVNTDVQSRGWYFNQFTTGGPTPLFSPTANIIIYPSNSSNNWHTSIPEEARRYITIRAARIAHTRLIGTEENFKFSYQEEVASLAALQQQHVRNSNGLLSFNSYPTELKNLGIDEYLFLQGNLEEKLANLKLSQNIKEQTILDKQATKLDEEIDLLQSQDLKVQEETDLLQSQDLKVQSETGVIDAQKLKTLEEVTLTIEQKKKLAEESKLITAQELKVDAEKLNVEEQTKLLTAQELKTDEETKLITAQELKVDEETKLITAQELKTDEETKLITAQELKVDAETELLTAQELKVDEETKLVTAQELKVDAETELLTAQELKTDEETKLITAQELKVDAETELLTAQELKVDEETKLITAQELKVDAETELLTAQELKVDEETKLITAQELKTDEETKLITAQELKVDAETELVKDTEAKTEAEKDLIVAQKTKLTEETAFMVTEEKNYNDNKGVSIGTAGGAIKSYKDYRPEMRIMGFQETTFNGLPAYKKKELLHDAQAMRTARAESNSSNLGILNNILRLIGEETVSNTSESSIATEAHALMNKTNEELQARGWWFNTETDVEVVPNNSLISYLASWLSIELNDVPTTKQKIGNAFFLRNLDTKKYNEWEGTQKATIIYKRDLDETPQKFQELLEVRVARLLTELYPQSGIDVQRLPKMEAELNAYFKDRENDQGNYSVFDNYDAAVRVGINRSYNLF